MPVKLHLWTDQYKEELAYICNNTDRSFLTDRIPDPYGIQDAEAYIALAEQSEGKTGFFRAIIFNNRVVGTISVVKKTDIHQKDAELGYFLVRDVYSKGIMTEAVKQILELSFMKLDLVRISAYTFAENIASQRVLEKNNFIYEGKLKNAIFKNGQIHDELLFGKLKENL